MAQLTLTWMNGQPPQTVVLTATAPMSASLARPSLPVPTRIGRDPARCVWVLSDPTVSGLHVEIDYQPEQGFVVRNLRDSNPPVVDGVMLTRGDRPLGFGSQIQLGQTVLQVTALQDDRPVAPTQLGQPVLPDLPPEPQYGLKCPECQRISDYDRAELGCPWCGTSLAAAVSVLLPDAETGG